MENYKIIELTQHKGVNVEIVDEAFYMPQLDRHRRIWIYKPTGYADTNKRYPVVYMHDGQNLFDQATAFGDEWGVDETLHSMLAECIVVGIDNSEKRLNEYNFRYNEEYGEGEGRKYIQFIVEALKPFIDLHYKTLPERENTHIAGSSMGGLISLYGAMYFPETFGGAGVFSPALWIVPDAATELRVVAEQNKDFPQKFYFYGGAKEGGDMLHHIYTVSEMLKEFSHYSVDVEVDPEGDHSENRWSTMFPNYYLWLAQK